MKRIFCTLFTAFLLTVLSVHQAPAKRIYIPSLDEHVHVNAIFDADGDSLQLTPRGSASIHTNEQERLESGFSFLASERWTSVSNGDTRVVLIDNPSGSARNAVGMVIRGNATAKMQLDLFANVTEDVAGTTLPANNANLGSDTSSVVTVTTGGGYSGLGDPLFESIVPGGGTGGIQIGGSSEASTFFIPPGSNLLLRATNNSGGGEDLVINVKWIEF